MQLVGPTAVVTGGAQGLGYFVADFLMDHGASVAILDRNFRGAADACVRLRQKHRQVAIPLKCDVGVAGDVQQAFQEVRNRLGPVHILVNNAGGGGGLHTLRYVSEAEWNRVLSVNLTGTFLCTREVIRGMIRDGVKGAIVNISSINATTATEGLSHYSAAKAGVEQFTRVVANEVGVRGIRVNAVAPGLVHTSLTTGLTEGGNETALIDRIPMGRIGEPEDIARVILFLCSDMSAWMTGVTLAVDGGQHLRGLDYLNTLRVADTPQQMQCEAISAARQE